MNSLKELKLDLNYDNDGVLRARGNSYVDEVILPTSLLSYDEFIEELRKELGKEDAESKKEFIKKLLGVNQNGRIKIGRAHV